MSNVVSANNSSTSILAGAATFTGEGELLAEYPDVMASCYSDVAGTLYFDFSINGTDWRTFPSAGFSVSAGIHEFHTAVKGPRYFRARYVNGSDAQTTFQLMVAYGSFRQPSAPLNQTLGTDSDALVVRPYPSEIDLAEGRLGGVTQRDKFGYAEGLGTEIQLGTPSTWVDIWTQGGLRTSPTSSFTPYVASDDDSDDQVVTLTYLDASGLEQTVDVTLNGQTPVSAAVTATEVFRVYNSDSTPTAGDVYVATANDFTNGVPDNQSEVLCAFSANDQQSQVLAFRVPSDMDGIITNIELSLGRANGSAGAADLTLDIRESGGVWRAIRKYQMVTAGGVSKDELIKLEPSTDVRVRVRDVSDANSAISGRINYLLVAT